MLMEDLGPPKVLSIGWWCLKILKTGRPDLCSQWTSQLSQSLERNHSKEDCSDGNRFGHTRRTEE